MRYEVPDQVVSVSCHLLFEILLSGIGFSDKLPMQTVQVAAG